MDRLLESYREGEDELVARARRGDAVAFEELIRREFGRVYALLFRLVGNHEDAEDLAQESFVRAWKALATLRGGEALSPWLRRIALHLARDHHRVRVRRGTAGELTDQVPGSGPRRARAPGEEASGRETARGLREALERLPDRLRAPLFLRVLEGLDYDQVAEATGVRPATARTQVMQARKLLLRWLKPWLDGRTR